MPIKSDLVLENERFHPKAVPQDTAELNDALEAIMKRGPAWYEVGARKYREMRWKGQTSLPKPAVLESGINLTIPSREAGRQIPCRVFKPPKNDIKGIFMHIHGGGWVLQSEHYQDYYLKFLADNCSVTVISIGYRLAPESPFPAGPDDCYDAAEYLIEHGKADFGSSLKFIGGESAGGHLSVLTAFHLIKNVPSFSLQGLILHFGAYDLSGLLPSVHHFSRSLILEKKTMHKFIEAFLPNTTEVDRRNPAISPLFADLKAFGWGKLPPALFTCGTEDPLIDDSVLMAAKWQMNGNEGILKIYPGAPHGFVFFPEEACEGAGQALREMKKFILEKMQEQ